jgi:hypothetical protein
MPRKTVRYRADIIQAMSLGASDYPLQPDDPGYDWRLLAEGVPGSPSGQSLPRTCCMSCA